LAEAQQKRKDLQTYLLETTETFLRRHNSRMRGAGRALELSIDVREDDFSIFLDFQGEKQKCSLVLPKARRNEFGNLVVGDRNDRALCPFMVVQNGQPTHVSYEQLIGVLLSTNIEELFPQQGKRNFIDKILFGFQSGRGRLAVSLCQRFLNLNLFNALPLSGTPMQDWAMNRRMMIFDPVFETLRPDEKLEYQRRKNELLFPWSSIGLSDGAAAVKNYILQDELRKYTAFGLRHHNPIRNLYSTLGMKGPEVPWVVSRSAYDLEQQGVKRGGWNWMTVFLDLPDNFEDQILVAKHHAGKEVTYLRSFTIFGEEEVDEGDTLVKGRVIGVNEDESPVIFDVDCERAKVIECKDGSVPFDGVDQPVRLVTLEVTYCMKDGVKITNQHGNKGIVRLMDLGKVQDGECGGANIDVIVSARSVQKRKNFGQILEALATATTQKWHEIQNYGARIIIKDDLKVTQAQVEAVLGNGKHMVGEDGCMDVETPWGDFRTICGYVHWGITKTPEEQLWQGKNTWETNQRGLRTRGNKVSTIEFKALTTLLGPKSKVVKEILSHQQGVEEVRELLHILNVMKGDEHLEFLKPTIDPERLVYIPAGMGTFHTYEGLMGTVADEEMYPNGCYIQLPMRLQITIPNDRTIAIQEGIAGNSAYLQDDCRVFEFDKLPMPPFELRQPWKHPTGKYGLSDLATTLNQILEGCDRLKLGEIKPQQLSAMVFRYFHMVSQSLSLKTGKVSQYLMAVRYPHSSKATAVLGQGLKPNWVEIHKDMARDIKVEDGDYVIVERFPCLGFMSTRIQRVRVTDDPQCKYTIRVSENSLVSMNLDFDGDVIYIMSFHTDGAKEELKENFHNPHPQIKEVLDRMNGKKVPMTRAMTFQDMKLQSFAPMEAREHADLNATSLAVKLWTGPVIALCYSLMRIVEGNIPYHDREGHINVEVFLDKVGNSVFSQKHGTKSLREECVEAVCLADEKALIELGFPERQTQQLCNIIRMYAQKLGVGNQRALVEHYQRHLGEGRSHIINAIVRRFHKTYFATRANLHPIDLLDHLGAEPHDLVGHLIRTSLAPKKEAGSA